MVIDCRIMESWFKLVSCIGLFDYISGYFLNFIIYYIIVFEGININYIILY